MFVCEHLETQGLSTTMSVSGWSPFFRVRVRGRDMNVATQVFTNTQIQTRAFTVSVNREYLNVPFRQLGTRTSSHKMSSSHTAARRMFPGWVSL